MSIQFAKMAVCLVGMALAMGSTQSFAKTYYKWVDSQGSTHYTTTPPPKGAKHLNKVSTYGSQPLLKNPTSNSEQPSQDKDKVVQEVTNVAVEKGAPAVPVPPAPSVSAPR